MSGRGCLANQQISNEIMNERVERAMKQGQGQGTFGIEIVALSLEAIEIVGLVADEELEIVDVLLVVLPQPFSVLHRCLSRILVSSCFSISIWCLNCCSSHGKLVASLKGSPLKTLKKRHYYFYRDVTFQGTFTNCRGA